METSVTVSIHCPLCDWGLATTAKIPSHVVLDLLRHIGAEHCDGMQLPPALETLLRGPTANKVEP